MNSPSQELDNKFNNLDLNFFESIESQTSVLDKQSLLAIQNAVRRKGDYIFLEIGSHLGGTIQPYLVDPLCTKIFSIDKRSLNIPDERGLSIVYEGNSTDRMLSKLKLISGGNMDKLCCIDSDSESIDVKYINERPNLLFIDGEHTNKAVVKDFNLCFKLIQNDGIIVFHDVKVIYNGIRKIMKLLKDNNIKFRNYYLPSSIYVLEIGNPTIVEDPNIKNLIEKHSKGHITLLKESFFYNRPKLSNFIVKFKSVFKR